MWAISDEQGNFRFEDIESGDYPLGYEIWRGRPSNSTPYPTWYFPGVADRSAAQVITIEPGETIDGLGLALPPPDTPRTIRIRVVWPDGSLVGEGSLDVRSRGAGVTDVSGRSRGGRITFMGYQERDYEFTARYWVNRLQPGEPRSKQRIAESEPVKLAPGAEPAEVVLVVREPARREEEQ